MIDRLYRVYCFWRIHGTAALRQLVRNRIRSGKGSGIGNPVKLKLNLSKPVSASEILQDRFEPIKPLRTYALSDTQARRINIVTDSFGSSSLFGGVGTALIFSALLANRLDIPLRIITRTERPKAENIESVLSLYGITLRHEVQLKFAAFYDEKYELDVFARDIFITTSWWSTAATLSSIPAKNIIYLLQEDERMFYAFGDDRQKCEQTLKSSGIRFVINTKLLFDHFVSDGFFNIRDNGSWFEPAFPSQVFYPRNKIEGEKRKFFFYARPNNPRNLFYLGIDVIEQVITKQVLDLDRWQIYFVGKDIPIITFSNGYTPIRCENLSWSEYAQLAGTIDLGLSLMYTPHPSYPPLDLVASGAIVVTNRFGSKTDMSGYSKNLICAEPERDALVDALRQAALRAEDTHTRDQNYRENKLAGDWQLAFDDILRQLRNM